MENKNSPQMILANFLTELIRASSPPVDNFFQHTSYISSKEESCINYKFNIILLQM